MLLQELDRAFTGTYGDRARSNFETRMRNCALAAVHWNVMKRRGGWRILAELAAEIAREGRHVPEAACRRDFRHRGPRWPGRRAKRRAR